MHRNMCHCSRLTSSVVEACGVVASSSARTSVSGGSGGGGGACDALSWLMVISDDDGLMTFTTNPPTPCRWQAPASAKKIKRKTRPAKFAGARGGGSNLASKRLKPHQVFLGKVCLVNVVADSACNNFRLAQLVEVG